MSLLSCHGKSIVIDEIAMQHLIPSHLYHDNQSTPAVPCLIDSLYYQICCAYNFNCLLVIFISDDKPKETDPEKEKELSDRIKKIQEQNEKILQRQKEIEHDIEQYA